mgnify:CR=1 FL=1
MSDSDSIDVGRLCEALAGMLDDSACLTRLSLQFHSASARPDLILFG